MAVSVVIMKGGNGHCPCGGIVMVDGRNVLAMVTVLNSSGGGDCSDGSVVAVLFIVVMVVEMVEEENVVVTGISSSQCLCG